MIPPYGETNISPTPALAYGIFDPAIVRANEAPSKYNFQYGSSSTDNIASSGRSHTRGESSGSGCAAKKSVVPIPLLLSGE